MPIYGISCKLYFKKSLTGKKASDWLVTTATHLTSVYLLKPRKSVHIPQNTHSTHSRKKPLHGGKLSRVMSKHYTLM